MTRPRTTASVLAQLPGTEMVETVTVLRGELGAPHHGVLPVLAARSDVAESVPRTVGVLTELWCDLQPHGWRLTRRPGRESRAAESLLAGDINVMADVLGSEDDGDREPVTLELLGPVSLAAGLHLHNGDKALRDIGARRDVAEAMADGLQDWIRRCSASWGGRSVILRLDEPELRRVRDGLIPTASGYRTLRAVPGPEIDQALQLVAASAHAAGAVDVEIVIPEGIDPRGHLPEGCGTVWMDTPPPDPERWEPVAALVEEGQRVGLLVEALRVSAGHRGPGTGRLVDGIAGPWMDLGLSENRLAELLIAPPRGLEATTPQTVRATLARATDLAHGLQQTALGA